MYSTDVPVPALLIQKWPPAPGGRTAMPQAFTISGLTICGWKLALLATRIVSTNWLSGAAVVARPPLAINAAATTAAVFMSSFPQKRWGKVELSLPRVTSVIPPCDRRVNRRAPGGYRIGGTGIRYRIGTVI